MSANSTHVGAILTAIEGLGYKLAKDVFDFEVVPSSIMDKAYRFEVSTGEVTELAGGRVEKLKKLNLWVAYKLTAGGNNKTAILAMLDSAEAVEDALMDAVSSLPSIVMESSMSKYVENYIVFNVGFNFTYWRDL